MGGERGDVFAVVHPRGFEQDYVVKGLRLQDRPKRTIPVELVSFEAAHRKPW
jgi:hypothetical protein